MKGDDDIGALLEVVKASGSDPALRDFLTLLHESNASLLLASSVAHMVTDLFGGSDPRKVAEVARRALAVYSITKLQGPGADLLRRPLTGTEP